MRCPDRADDGIHERKFEECWVGHLAKEEVAAQALFHPTNFGPLRSILGLGPRTTSSLSASTTLDDDQVAAIVSAFGTFGPRQLDDEAQIEIRRAWRIAHLCGGARVRATRWKGRADDCDNGEQCMPSSETAARGQFSAILGLGRFELA